VSAHLDPAVNEAAKAAVALGLTDSVSALTGDALVAELRRLALRAALDAHYHEHPSDRPEVAEVALYLAQARGLVVTERDDLPDALRAMSAAMGDASQAEALLAATAAHLEVSEAVA
jgi:hypothetical protein